MKNKAVSLLMKMPPLLNKMTGAFFIQVDSLIASKMRSRIAFSLCLLIPFLISSAKERSQDFNKSAFYAALSSGKPEQINNQLEILKHAAVAEKEAYEGTLLMTKAGMVAGTKEKLSLFKSGRKKLESAISADGDNIEYRFLRLIIQEHAPKITRYQGQLDADGLAIRSNFKSLSPFLQQAITNYSKRSKALKTI